VSAAVLEQCAARPKIDNVLAARPPDVEILALNERASVLAVQPYVHNELYWQVFFDTNRAIRDTFGAAGYPVPEVRVQLRQPKAASCLAGNHASCTHTLTRCATCTGFQC